MNRRLVILVILVLAIGLIACVAVSQMKSGANSEAGAPSVAETDAGSIEDYYPELNDSYGGYPIPTPDGSLRLTGLTRIPDSIGTLVVKTDFIYDDEGNLAGANRYFDAAASYKYFKLFFGWDPEVCIIEPDDQGRIWKVTFYPGMEDEYVTEFTYPNNDAVQNAFHVKTVYSDGTVHERDEVVSDFDARNEIRKSQEELSPDSEFEYDEDGLVIGAKIAGRTRLNGKQMNETYFYQYVADNDGFLEYVLGQGRISFNNHGYLTEYPLVPAGGCNYEYRYAPAA